MYVRKLSIVSCRSDASSGPGTPVQLNADTDIGSSPYEGPGHEAAYVQFPGTQHIGQFAGIDVKAFAIKAFYLGYDLAAANSAFCAAEAGHGVDHFGKCG